MDDLFEQIMELMASLIAKQELHPDDRDILISISKDFRTVYDLTMDRRLESVGIDLTSSNEALGLILGGLIGGHPGESKKPN